MIRRVISPLQYWDAQEPIVGGINPAPMVGGCAAGAYDTGLGAATITPAVVALQEALSTIYGKLQSCEITPRASIEALAKIEESITVYANGPHTEAANVTSLRAMQQKIVQLGLTKKCGDVPPMVQLPSDPRGGGPLDFLAGSWTVAGITLPVLAWIAGVVVLYVASRDKGNQ